LKTFTELGVAGEYVKALAENNIKHPTEIQLKAIPFLLEKGTDFIGQAPTGTGKTAAFGLPLLQSIEADKNKIQGLILAPTRELCQQIAKQLFKFSKYAPKRIFIESIYGGPNSEEQISALSRPTHIVVATPGRLIELLERKALHLGAIKTIILDEADEMLSMGFKEELDTILRQTSGRRFTWLFSATMPGEIKRIIKTYMEPNAYKVEVGKEGFMNKNIEHQYVVCDADEKLTILLHFLKSQGTNRGIIFCKTKAAAQTLAQELTEKDILTDSLHGDLLQIERDKVMRAFKNKKLQILVATDLAARGLDVENLSYVVHYQLPDKADYFIHRSGRTARAGNKGLSLVLILKKELEEMRSIAKNLGIYIREVPR